MRINQPADDLVISYLSLRRSVGLLGICLPVVLITGSFTVGHCRQFQPSISHYYYTIMGSYFVGTLCAVSLFLFSYKGYDRIDRATALVAAVSALVVAFCPTGTDAASHCTYIVIPDALPLNNLHYSAAAILFGSFAFFSLFLFTKSSHPKMAQTKQKKERNGVYRLCGTIILVCIIVIAIIRFIEGLETEMAAYRPILVLESLALTAFGISWLVKGEAILPDK